MAITVNSALKRQAIIADHMTALARILSPLRAFARAHNNVPLQGTNVINVPYISLDATASTDWNSANGYVAGDATVGAKTITVNKRKYQSLGNDSETNSRQPYTMTDELVKQKLNKLAYDVLADIMSAITAANFGAAGYTGAASGFNVAGVGSLRKKAVDANWPEDGRSLVLNSSYDQYAMLDSAVLTAMNYGSSEAVREGRVMRLLGFDYYGGQYVPTNGENLGGFMCLPAALLFGCAPIAPTPAVRQQLTAYEQFTIPELDIVITYREFANAQMDTDQTIVECSYGYAVGEAAALQRIVTA